VERRTNTIALQFDKICQVLESMGYLEPGTGGALRVSDAGRMLARIYATLDLITTECIRRGAFDGLSAPQLAAALSTLIYEARRTEFGVRPPRMPDAETDRALKEIRTIHREVSLVERDFRLPRGPEPEVGFARSAFAWAAGRPLGEILDESGLTAGDFVRWVRQVIDFADQVRQAAGALDASAGEGAQDLRRACRELRVSMQRGVVAIAGNLGDHEA
jgi:ATP-dependent RNA helicase HelY